VTINATQICDESARSHGGYEFGSRQAIADCRLPIADCQLPTGSSRDDPWCVPAASPAVRGRDLTHSFQLPSDL
jgi:hypothetical protein